MIREKWIYLAALVLDYGKRRGDTRERTNLSLAVTSELCQRPNFNVGLAETMVQHALGYRTLDELLAFVPKNKELFEHHPPESIQIKKDLPNILLHLKANRESRKAIISFDNSYCWSALHFLITDAGLETILYQRSCDVWLGLPYDAYLLNGLHNFVAEELQSDVHKVIMHIGSLHVYDKDEEKIRTAWKNGNFR